jgi:hypothetical protein
MREGSCGSLFSAALQRCGVVIDEWTKRRLHMAGSNPHLASYSPLIVRYRNYLGGFAVPSTLVVKVSPLGLALLALLMTQPHHLMALTPS